INGHFNNSVEGMFADRYKLKNGHRRFRSFTWKSFRYIKLMLRSCTEPVTVHQLRALQTEYPFVEAGGFQSSDERLNKVFDICRYTIGLCSNDSIMDTPWREQAQFVGDVAAVTLGGIYSCFGETRLPAKFLRQSAANQTPNGLLPSVTNSLANSSFHPDYSLWWIQGLWNHYRYTGEESWIHQFYPHTLKIIDAYLENIGEHGLIDDMPHAIFIDWANVDRRGICTALNAMFYGISGLVRQMAAIKGDKYTERRLEQVRAKLKSGFHPILFDEARGCYADGVIDGRFSPITSEQANMAAIYWELCDDPVQTERIVNRLWGEDPIKHTEAQPFFSMITLRALDRMGCFDQAVELIRKRWGRRMVDKGAASTYEEWGLNGSWRKGEFAPIMRTQSHAWSAYPAEFLIYALTGFDIVEPGCTAVSLRPQATEFDYEVAVPTPKGAITVRCRNRIIEVSAPSGVQVV
ncbi:MAG: alpha-L-rhamnosidase, partial [Paenibacillus sp.]|nr:alpha-L-rhamnosidase [Paenibacillus sp.]